MTDTIRRNHVVLMSNTGSTKPEIVPIWRELMVWNQGGTYETHQAIYL